MSQTAAPDKQDARRGAATGAHRQQGAGAEVPERPALAPGVELSGQMQESGFEQQQWLVQRDGRFIQLTELLYRVAEQANGERTVDEMAAGVAEATGRRVSADNVRQLVASKLIPLGLVLKADGTVAQPAGGGAGARSPLAVNMRMAMVSPRMVDGIARVFQPLFLPPILIGALLVAAAAQLWLFFVHGVAGGVHDALYAPGLLLAALGIIIVGTAFHEFGHAAALRYGGGKVRGMGVGLYIIYPAFYTDVTDAYRLGRWARVRTDLGGFYFNLIFATALMALYAFTGWEVLLLAVVLIDLEIVHQCLPFVRLDGYWALADLTGIPDFFSQIGPFLRTVLPLPWWKGSRLPNLKGWVKAVFALYILITVPLLLFLLFFMVKSVPRILATAWDSFQQQSDKLSAAWASGSALGIAAAAVQMLILALPTLGLLYILFSLGRKVFGSIWAWSRPTPGRRVLGSLGSTCIVGLLAFLWAPQLPFLRMPGPLYAQAQENFVPIAAQDRGRMGEAVPYAVFWLPPSVRESLTAPATPAGTPTPSPTAQPTVSPTLVPVVGPTPSPTGGAGAAPTPVPPAPATDPVTPAATPPAAPAPALVTPTAAPAVPPTAPAPVVLPPTSAPPTATATPTPTAVRGPGTPSTTPAGAPLPAPAPAATPTPEPAITTSGMPEPTATPTPAPVPTPVAPPTAAPQPTLPSAATPTPTTSSPTRPASPPTATPTPR